jgi:hypothetical protein
MSLPAASTGSAPAHDDGGAEPSLQKVLERTHSWEEPHPGVPIPLQEGTGMQASSRFPSEAWRGDMAAKGYGYFRNKSGVARRYSRPGIRPRLVRSPRTLQQNSPQEETSYTRRRVHFEPIPSPDESTLCPTPATSTTYGNTMEDADMSGWETPSPPLSDYRSLSLDLPGFSANVDKALDGVYPNASSLTVCEVGSDTRAAPGSDMYGWEAELTRKLESGCHSPCDTSLVCSCLAHVRPRHTGLKRNILQRVFSLGDVRHRSE